MDHLQSWTGRAGTNRAVAHTPSVLRDNRDQPIARPLLPPAYEKATICSEMAITHFIDDRYGVLKHLVGVVPHLFLFGPQQHPSADPVIATLTWDDAEREVLATLGE